MYLCTFLVVMDARHFALGEPTYTLSTAEINTHSWTLTAMVTEVQQQPRGIFNVAQ